MINLDLYWLAGVLEGEGCFSQTHEGHGNLRRYPVIQVNMTDQDVIARVASLLGSNVSGPRETRFHGKTVKPSFSTSVSGRRATPFMRQLLPLMGERRSKRIAWLLGLSEVEA